MFLLPAVLVGVLAGLLLGGTLARLERLRLRWTWLFFLAIGLQLIAYPSVVFPFEAPGDVAVALQICSYGALLAVTLANLRVTGMAVAGLGMACNLVAIVTNGGHMPVLPDAMAGAGLAYDGTHNNSVADPAPQLVWLVDRWTVPPWVPWGNVFSIGDVLIAAGVVIVVAAAMGASPPGLRHRHAYR